MELKSSYHKHSKLEDLSNIGSADLRHAEAFLKTLLKQSDPNIIYQECLQLLRLGGLEAEIPRLVVFGQQSMGKTTLLDYIMGGPVGFSSTDTGTKQPVVIMLKPAKHPSDPIKCILQGKELDMQRLQEAMKKHMTDIQTISSEELELIISIPNAVHAVFVDLPGIKDDSKEGAELTRRVVRNYVRNNPNDLYILVKKASDDPANWPWTLREFILSEPPTGLGLTPRQTIVVGTRAKDFLINEKTDVRTHKELMERVQKRAVKDSSGQTLPLFLLELFSLSIEEKEQLSFQDRRKLMNEQITNANLACQDLLLNQFEASRPPMLNQLLKVFNVDQFRIALNQKFQVLLDDQLHILERRLHQRQSALTQQIAAYSSQLAKHDMQRIREGIRLCVRELTQIVTDILTGNYMIIRLPDGGERFLQQFGGSLRDNLVDGHNLAVELFANTNCYDPQFLDHIQTIADSAFQKIDAKRKQTRKNVLPTDQTMLERTVTEPEPILSEYLQPGQYVRVTIQKDLSQMLGYIESFHLDSSRFKPKLVNVLFEYIPTEGNEEQTQSKPVEISKLNMVTPLSLVLTPNNLPPKNYRCWKRHLRSDEWIGAIPVMIKSIALSGPFNSYTMNQAVQGTVSFLCLDTTTDDLSGSSQGEAIQTDNIDQFFCESSDLSWTSSNEIIFEDNAWRSLSATQRIAGDFSDQKLLNQLSLINLARWFKFHIAQIQPNRKFPDHVILQLMRSVKHVMDKADWEPLVADLVQANVQGDLLYLSRLASCATATALLRVMNAGIHEMRRLVDAGDLPASLAILTKNTHFISDLDHALSQFCRQQAIKCADTMRDLIFEQTHAIHFEMIEDFFNSCKQFEQEFLSTNYMDEVTRNVKKNLIIRKQKLGLTDIYDRQSSGISQDLITEEVKIQFWIVKMLLATPLTTKLYMYFIKDIKDKSKHLASEAQATSLSQSDIEKVLIDAILNHPSDSERGNQAEKSDDELNDQYGFSKKVDQLKVEIEELKRTSEYIKMALQGVAHFQSQIMQRGNVDFLTKLTLGGQQSNSSL